eukprot:357479-Chlamydomonas_euryale.AAC.3
MARVSRLVMDLPEITRHCVSIFHKVWEGVGGGVGRVWRLLLPQRSHRLSRKRNVLRPSQKHRHPFEALPVHTPPPGPFHQSVAPPPPHTLITLLPEIPPFRGCFLCAEPPEVSTFFHTRLLACGATTHASSRFLLPSFYWGRLSGSSRNAQLANATAHGPHPVWMCSCMGGCKRG